MHYINKLTVIHRDLSIYVPDPECIKSTYEQLLEINSAIHFPYWAKIWASSKALATFLYNEPKWAKGKAILEIGAGIGLPTFSIAKFASTIIVSDYEPEAVALLEKNILHLGLLNVTAMCIDWNQLPDHIHAEIVLLSDINYAPDQFEGLLQLIHQLLEKNRTIIIATPNRLSTTLFAENLQPFIKHAFLQKVEEAPTQFIDIQIWILYN